MARKESKLKQLVLDSSVVIKWFSQEIHTEKALELRERFLKGENVIAVPDLQLYEIANALRYKKELQKRNVADAVKSLLDLGITIVVPTMDVVERAVEIAYDFDVTIYDAYFVALAESLSFTFVTADKKLHQKLKPLKFAILLEDV